MNRIIVFCLLLTAFWGLCGEQDSLTFMVQWFPQSQFAGYIAAVEEGYFSDNGIDVELVFSDGSSSPLQLLSEGEIDLCTAWLSQAMKERADGAEIVHIQQIMHKSSLLFIARAGSGINTPADMNDKRISMWGNDFSLLPNAFLSAQQIEAEIIPQAYTIETLLAGACDLSLAMYYNEYYQIILAGVEPNELTTFFFSDYGLNFPEDGLYTSESLLAEYPAAIQKFTDAVKRGWQFALQNQDQTLDYVMEYCEEYNMRTNRALQQWMLKTILESIEWKELSETDYQMVGGQLLKQGMIESIPEYADFVRGNNHENQ